MSVFEINNIIENAFNGNIDKYAIYLRKSRADIEAEKMGEGETLARHRRILTDLAARKGYYVEDVYEEVVSGETIEARPQIQKLIQACYDGKYRGIIIIEVTRLSRGSSGDAQIIMDCLKFGNRNKGVLVITPTKVYDVANSHDDEEYMEFELFMSRREYKMIKRRMDRGKIQAVVEGNYMASYRPYGYDIVKTKTARTLIPNPSEAPIVKNIFKWIVEDNLTPGKVVKKLDAMGIPTYTGDADWDVTTIKSILQNPVYKGKVRWNDRMQVKTMVGGELVASRPRNNHGDSYMEFDGKHKEHALVDEETFRAASSRFVADKTKSNLELKNPLAGLFKCGKCGKPMVHKCAIPEKNVRARYIHYQKSGRCKVKSVVAEDVLKAFVHALKLYIEDFEMKIDNLPTIDGDEIKGQIEVLQAEMRKTEKKLSKLFDSWENDTISDNEFVQRKAVHNARIEAIKQQMRELEESMPEREEYEEMVVYLSDALEALLDDSIDATTKNIYLKQVVDRVEFSRENNQEFILDVFLK